MARKRSPTDRPLPDGEADEQRSGAAKASGQPEVAPPSPAPDGTGGSCGTPVEAGAPPSAPDVGEHVRTELEEALKKGQVLRKVATSGKYRGTPVVVVPIIKRKEAIAVIGVFDITRGSVMELMARAKK